MPSAKPATTLESYAETWDKSEPVAKFILPHVFDPEVPGLVNLNDFSSGFAWVLEPIPASHLTGLEKARRSNQLAQMISNLRDGSRLQIIVLPTRNIETELANYRSNGGTKSKVFDLIEKSKVEMFQQGVDGMGVRAGDLEFTLKSVRLMLTLVIEPDAVQTSPALAAKDALSKGESDASSIESLPGVKRWVDSYHQYKKELLLRAQGVESALHGAGLRFRRVGEEEFIRFYRSMVEMHSGPRDKINVYRHAPLADQLVTKEVRFTRDGYVLSDGYYHSVLVIDQVPSECYAGMMSEPHPNLAMNSLIDYVIDGALCVNIYLPKRQDIDDWCNSRYKLANEGDGDPIERATIVEECKLIRHWTKNEGRRMVDVQFSVSMADTSKVRARNRIELLQAKLLEMGFAARIEESAAPTYWCHQLPFGWKPSMPSAKRVMRRLDLVVTNLLPIYLQGRGTKNKVFMCLNQRGEPLGLDFYESPTAYNWCAVGESGAGKSVTINAILCDYLRSESQKVFVCDIGGSFRQVANMVGAPEALYVDLSKDDKIPFNAFAGTFDGATSFLLEWIPFLATRQDEKLEETTKGRLAKAIERTYKKRLRQGITYRKISELFERFPAFEIDRAFKRVRVHWVEEDVLISLKDLKASEAANKPNFDLYYEIRITGRINADKKRQLVYELESLREQEAKQLRDTFPVVDQDEHGVYVLTMQPSQVESLTLQGWECRLTKDYMVLQCPDRTDFDAVERFGLSLIMDKGFLETRRKAIEAELRAKHGGTASNDLIRQELDAAVAAIPGGDYFDLIEGTADLQEEVLFSQLAAELRDAKDPEMDKLADALSPYYGDGAYAGFFDRPSAYKLDKHRFVVWDFTQLFAAKDMKLIGAMLGAITQQVNAYCLSPRSGQFRKMLIIDELRRFQDIYITDPFIDEILRQGRKFGFGVGLGTQSINDVAHASRALLEHIQFLLIGAQQESVIQEMKDTLKFNVVQRSRAASVITEKGVWAEFMLVNKRMKICEIMRVMIPPFLYWMFTTDKEDKPERDAAKRKFALEGYKPRDATLRALKHCAELYPRGKSYDRKAKLK